MEMTRKNFFIGSLASLATGAMLPGAAQAQEKGKVIQGFDEIGVRPDAKWVPFSDKKVRVGLAGNGCCHFAAAFFFQNHPNVEVVAAADLVESRAAALAKATGAKRTYLSAEEMIDKEGKNMDAVFIATDAASHADLVLRALDRGYHVASAVPALFGIDQLDRADKLMEAVKKSGKVYAMYETTAFRPQAIAMRRLYKAGAFGKMVYTEGEYFHWAPDPTWGGLRGHNNWRVGLPPQYYPTHSNGFYTCVTGGSFTEVTCVGTPGEHPVYKNRDNPHKNPFHSEVAFFKTSEGGSARMTVAWGLPGYHGELGRNWGEKGCYGCGANAFRGGKAPEGLRLTPDGIPTGGGGHGGSHGQLTDDFLRAILVPGHKICVNIACALNTTVAGIYAHMSALKGGETLKIPQFKM